VPAVLRATCPAAITAVLPSRRQGDGWLASDAAMLIPSLLRADVIVLGPGLGRGDEEEKLVADLLEVPRRPPMVIDADALFAISRRPGLLKHLTDRDILTPHPGEAAALLGTTVNDVQLDRVEALRSLTRNCPSVCILKGEGTLIGRRGEATVISPWSVPQLAVAGSGDVLAGLAAALLARRSDAMEAAAIAVWAHALAGLDLSQAFPMRGNTPQDIANAIPMAMAAAGA
jgi:NAD(P)H-hydrate epimerase